MSERALWQYFKEVREAVERANRGEVNQPYMGGTFMVLAQAKDVELNISDVSEEDAILIASELSELGVKALIRASVICPRCQQRVPQQDYCTSCRARLSE